MAFGKVVPVPGQKGGARAAAAPGRQGVRDRDGACTGRGESPAPSTMC